MNKSSLSVTKTHATNFAFVCAAVILFVFDSLRKYKIHAK